MPLRKRREREPLFLPRHPSSKTKHLPVCRRKGEGKKNQLHVLEVSITSMDNSGCKATDETQSLKAIPRIARAHLWGSVATSSLALTGTSCRVGSLNWETGLLSGWWFLPAISLTTVLPSYAVKRWLQREHKSTIKGANKQRVKRKKALKMQFSSFSHTYRPLLKANASPILLRGSEGRLPGRRWGALHIPTYTVRSALWLHGKAKLASTCNPGLLGADLYPTPSFL